MSLPAIGNNETLVYTALGFTENPFVEHNSEREPHLRDYFVTPPYFQGVVGDPEKTRSTVVFAPRGGGKSAQRLILSDYLTELSYFVVDYVDFHDSDVTDQQALDVHLGRINTLVLRQLNEYIITNELEASVSEQNSLLLSRMSAKYRVKNSVPKFVNKHASTLSILPAIAKYQGFKGEMTSTQEIAKAILTDISLQTPETRLEDFSTLSKLVQSLGKKALCILVDKVDETGRTSAPEAAFRFISPVLCDVSLLETPGTAFKFFLWDQLKPQYAETGRPDRVTSFDCHWTESTLRRALAERLRAFSGKKISSLNQLSEEPGIEFDGIVVSMCDRSPRNMIRICEKIFASHADRSKHKEKISLFAFEQGILDYCRDMMLERYPKNGQKFVDAIKQVGKEIFTSSEIQSALAIGDKESSKRIGDWLSAGLIFFAGTWNPTVKDILDGKKSEPMFGIPDPALVRLTCAKSSWEMTNSWWLGCQSCGHGIFANSSNKRGTFNCVCAAKLKSIL